LASGVGSPGHLDPRHRGTEFPSELRLNPGCGVIFWQTVELVHIPERFRLWGASAPRGYRFSLVLKAKGAGPLETVPHPISLAAPNITRYASRSPVPVGGRSIPPALTGPASNERPMRRASPDRQTLPTVNLAKMVNSAGRSKTASVEKNVAGRGLS
jgi:hypothetical protein